MFVIIKESILIWFVTFIGQTKNKECARFHRQWGIAFIPLKTETLFRTNDGDFKGSSDPSHFIFEINVGRRRIRYRATLNLNLIFN